MIFYVLMRRGYVQAASVGLIAFITTLLLILSFLEAELLSATVMSSFIAFSVAALIVGATLIIGSALCLLILVFPDRGGALGWLAGASNTTLNRRDEHLCDGCH